MPEPNEIYYSPRADRFYQVGRSGAVSREAAIPTLRYDEDALRWRDQRGRLVPEDQLLPVERRVQRISGLDPEGRPFIKTVMADQVISEEAAVNQKLAANEQLVVRITVRTDDGVGHVFSVSSKLGGRQTPSDLVELAKRRARAELKNQNYDIDTPTVSGATINVSYLKREVAIE